ncbi:MAG TPA: Do family serine endopeptidase [Steroidobacteraceae bacterium]|nr:Do family serine endopeptidase [Steroidobacteraceae bacterium]
MKRFQLVAATVALSSLFVGGFSALYLGSAGPAQSALPAQVNDAPLPTLAPMIKKVSPSVVSIATRGSVQDARGSNPLFEDPLFRRFFGDEFPQGPSERDFQAAGSGVVVDEKNGYIITNAHVVKDAKEITVTTEDGFNYTAKVVGSDPGTDVAVLKLNEPDTKLPAIELGDSGKAEVGDFVVAIGNPFGLEHTVTSGIISAKGRAPGFTRDAYEDFIQTDASINPGNSGGALVNLRGELVGINSAILSRSGGNIGIGFAVPVNLVKNVMGELIQYGEVKRGLLGVVTQTLGPGDNEAVGVPANTQGALVTQVQKGSAAEKAGIKINDVVTSVNGRAVKSAPELRNSIGLLRVGDKVEVGLLRDGKPRKVAASIGARTDVIPVAADFSPNFAGATLEDADDGGGVVVRGVEPGSPAATYGLRPNDVIYGVNRAPVRNLEELKEAAGGERSLLLNIRRGNITLGLLMR